MSLWRTRGLPGPGRTIAWASLFVVISLSLLALVGWAFGIPVLRSVDPNWTSMSTITSLCLILSAAGVALILLTAPGERGPVFRFAPGVAVGFMGLIITASYGAVMTAGQGPEAGTFLFPETSYLLSFRMSLLGAVFFLVFGCALTLLASTRHRLWGVAHSLLLPMAFGSYVVPVSYILGVQDIHGWRHIPMAMNTGIAFCALCTAAFCARPDTWLMRVFTGDRTGNILARRLLPIILALPLMAGWLWMFGERHHTFESHTGVALFSVLFTCLLFSLLWLNAWSVNRIDMKRQASEHALKESEERFRNLAESMIQLVWIADGSGRSVYHNPRFVEFTGMESSTAAERWELVHPVDRVEMSRMWHEHSSDGSAFELPNRMRGKNGEYRWFLSRIIFIGDGQNRQARWFGTATDIHDLKLAEEALRNSMAMLAEAERIGHTGSWKRDLATNRVSWSDETRRIFALAGDEEALFETFKARLHPDDRDAVLRKLMSTEQTGEPMDAEFRIVLPDGSVRHISARAEAEPGMDGRPAFLHGFVLDTTEMKRLEEELIKRQKLDSIGTLAGGIAHDFNNLLTVIVGNIDLAKILMSDGERAKAALTKAERAAQGAGELARQLLTFSKGGYPMSRAIHPEGILPECVRLATSGSNIRADLKIHDHLPEVNADENQIRQVIQNIVVNAREAMPQGGRISIQADKEVLSSGNALALPEGEYVKISFSDEGPGIPDEILPMVFDPYFTTKDLGPSKGKGLGLSICYSIMKKHRGHIEVDSEKGKGTTVTIHLPANH